MSGGYGGYDDDTWQRHDQVRYGVLNEVRPTKIEACERWVPIGFSPYAAYLGEAPPAQATEDGKPATPFPVNETINRKLFLFDGDLCSMEVDVVVNFTSEKYNEQNGPSGRILALGGPDLQEELDTLDKCRSGEVRMTKAYNMPCQQLIHTVGPNYKAKYQTAAENTLHACYRESLKLCIENNLRTVAFPCFYSDRRGYPKDECVHLTLRTFRRWLERLEEKMDAIVFVTSREDEVSLFRETMPLYFPRSPEEEKFAVEHLPQDIGNAFGETEVEERKIRLGTGALLGKNDSDDEDDKDDGALGNVFNSNEGEDFDEASKKRLDTMAWDATSPIEAEHIYLRYLRQSATMDFNVLNQMNFVYTCEQDRYGRNVVVLLGPEFPADRFSTGFLLHFLVHKLDKIVREKYVMIYVNSGVTYANHPSFGLLKEMYTLFNMRFSHTMEQFFVVHPGLFFKAAFACAFLSITSTTWSQTIYIENMNQLSMYFDMKTLKLPPMVAQYEQELQSQGSVFGQLGSMLFG